MNKPIIKNKELNVYINILEDLNGKTKYKNFDNLIKDLLIEFGYKATRQEISNFYEPLN